VPADTSWQTPSTEIGSGSYRTHFPPPPSPSRSAAATRRGAPKALGPAARRPGTDLAATGCGHGRSARGRQRDARQGLRGEGSGSAGDPYRPRRGLAGRRTARPRERSRWKGVRRLFPITFFGHNRCGDRSRARSGRNHKRHNAGSRQYDQRAIQSRCDACMPELQSRPQAVHDEPVPGSKKLIPKIKSDGGSDCPAGRGHACVC
jgi:hypothetical protein